MLQIYRWDHIAQVVPELAPQVELLEGLFGFRRVREWTDAGTGVRGTRLAVPGSWGQCWEVLAPNGPGRVQDALDAQGGRGGLHHVAFEVPDVQAADAEVRRRGLTPTAEEPGAWLEISLAPPQHGAAARCRLFGPGGRSVCGEGLGETSDVEAVAAGDEPDLGIAMIDHVCQAFRDRDELAAWYRDLAGFVPVWRTPVDEHPDMADLVLSVPGSTISWEIIMPRGDDSFIGRFWDKSGAAYHHVTFEVRDWNRAMAACDHHGTPTFGENEGETDGGRWRDVFIHPKHTGGVLVQLFWEERPGVWVRSDKIHPR